MDAQELLRSRTSRAVFMIACIAIIVLLLLLKYTMGASQGLLGGTIDEIVASVVTLILISLVFVWLFPDLLRNTPLKVVPAFLIGDMLASLRKDAVHYWFEGRTGRDFRVATLPKLSENARTRSTTVTVHANILDPRRVDLCGQYADARNAVRFRSQDTLWTAESVQDQILATLLSIYLQRAHNRFLLVVVSLVPAFSAFRLDMSQDGALVTLEDDRHSAIWYGKDTDFHDAYKRECEILASQGRKLSADIMWKAAENPESTVADVVELFRQLVPELKISDERAKRIRDVLETNASPYS